ncbi:MAG: AlkZ family DNA glycosylase [Bacteroidota bacterium]|nr:AlkZ family DNA glycosylase [Bacteroidota bacterium]
MHKFKSVKELVAWMGAMQAQDYPMAKWAVGARLPHSTDTMIEAALNRGEILRTHVMRPTWHFVSADDIYWMLELTAPQIRASMKFREKWLGLTSAIVAKSNRVIEKALNPDRHLTREELITELNRAKIRTDEYRSGHLLMRAELDGLICSGRTNGKKQTYALLEQRAPKKETPSREESLKKIAQKYFSSHAPATIEDFSWWSGLSVTDTKNALEMVKSKFISETINGNTFWLSNSFPIPQNKSSLFLLPAYDEFLISYADRSASIAAKHQTVSVSSNGIFRPPIVIDGRVTGLWKRALEKEKLTIETTLFRAHSKKEQQSIQHAAEALGKFWGMKEVRCMF